MIKVCILDYGLGNIKSLHNALKKIGHTPQFFSDQDNEVFDVIFIPGVGSFSKASELLLSNKKIDFFLKKNENNASIFGICLGMQILFSQGQENGNNKGLNLIEGEVKKIYNPKNILPVVGYQKVIFNNKIKYLKPFNEQKFYFAHSYHAIVKNNENILGKTKINEMEYTSAVLKNRILGLQFHPEKSGEIGLELMKTFIEKI